MTYILNYEKFTSPYIHISHIICRVVLCFILSLKVIESLSVYLCFCASVCFFGLIDFKIGRQLQFGPLKIKQSFMPQTLPFPKRKFFRNFNYSWTIWWIQLEITDNLFILKRNFWNKIFLKFWILNSNPPQPPWFFFGEGGCFGG